MASERFSRWTWRSRLRPSGSPRARRNGVPPMAVQFSSPVVDSGGSAILGWNWNFGDGGTNSPVQNPTHTYSNTASFFPSLTCVNNNGDSVIGSGPAIVAAYPRSILNASVRVPKRLLLFRFG